MDHQRPHDRAARRRSVRQAGISERHLADRAGAAGNHAARRARRHVPEQLSRRLQGRRALAVAARARRQPLCLGGRLHVHPQADVSRRDDDDAADAKRVEGRTRAGAPRGQRDDRPHLAGWSDQGRQPGGEVSDRARREAIGLQLLWRAARQSRSDGGRDICQYAAAQPDCARHRGRRDDLSARWKPDDDLRRVGEVPRGERAAAGDRGQGVRIRVVARLGGRGRSCSASRR